VNRNNRLYFEPGPEPVYELCMCGMPNQGLDCCYHDLFLCGGKKRCWQSNDISWLTAK